MQRKSIVSGCAVAASLLFTALGTAVPAYASGGSVAFARANPTSHGQGGYEKSPAPASASASSTWVVPAVAASSPKGSQMAPGDWIFQKSSGAPSGGTVVEGKTSTGAAFYQAFLVFNGSGSPSTVVVSPGDKVTTSVSESAAKTTVTIKDLTTHKSQTASSSGGVPGLVLIGIETFTNGTSSIPIPTFTKIVETAASIDGMNLRAAGAVAVDLKETTKIDVHTSAPNAAGTSGTLTWVANN